MIDTLSIEPIGVVRSPFAEPAQAPRQPERGAGVDARIELQAGRGFEFALSDIETWRYLWVLFWFHRAESFRAKVRPPRSRTRRGLFATRAPHRPNPIGMSVVELVRVEGLVLHVRDVDILDGTPVLDIKPYVAYSDAVADAGAGWLDAEALLDPGPRWQVEFLPRAHEQLEFLKGELGVDLARSIRDLLSLGPAPHPYRRIKREGEGFVLAHKSWRARFRVRDQKVEVGSLGSGYRARELELPAPDTDAAELALHRKFVERFGYPGFS
ncbi:MAG: tRNA (N6-threonylcarbamoyladenosine(37)-N6)-methyltransferase TrmO [Polyangiaceae bacterium]